ncbi:MAG: HD domain-containing protein [Patescibacteria group bacterium]
MKTAQEIYDAYRIMPALQLHQLRVAAVAKTLCDNLTRDVDTHTVVLACLFHDMGNIIKSDLSLFPEFCEPEGVAHWQFVKNDFVKTYGGNTHVANVAIARELHLPDTVIRLIDDIGFSRLPVIQESSSYELKLVEYGDMRTGPHGVIPMDARIAEGKTRFENKHPGEHRDESEWESIVASAREIERQIFAEANIAPDDITEQSIQPLIAELRGFPLA